MLSAQPGWATKDIITSTLAVVSLAVTVTWNLLNRRHTDKVAREIRSESYDLEQWKETRSEINRALRDFEESATSISLLARGGHELEQLFNELDTENKKLSQKHVALVRELERAAFQPSWVVFAYGGVVGGESDWDRLNSVLGEVYVLTDADALRQELQKVSGFAHEIAATVNEAIRTRTLELHPGRNAI